MGSAQGVGRGDANNFSGSDTAPMSRGRRNGQRRNSCVMYAIRERHGSGTDGVASLASQTIRKGRSVACCEKRGARERERPAARVGDVGVAFQFR